MFFRSRPLHILTTSYNKHIISFFDLIDDVNLIISKHLLSDYKVITLFMSKRQDLQKILFGGYLILV